MTRSSWIAGLLVAALAYGLWECWDLMWACDDAYITFRYAANLVDGHGLIFNPGAPDEVVEGYSNFSWTLLMALGLGAGVAREGLWVWAGGLGLACHLGTALLLARVSWRMARSWGTPWLPVAAIALSLHHHWASLAVGGLETGLFTLLVTALALGAMGTPSARGAAGLGVLAALACWTRPDGALPALVVGLVLVWDAWRRREGARWHQVWLYGGAAALLLVPHLLWRRAYYGEWVPNTAFAKSASVPYAEQGLAYVGWYFRVYWVVALGGLGLLVSLLVGRAAAATVPPARSSAGPSPARCAGIALAIAVPYLGFVVWVGGDFMFSRFLLPVTPLLYLGFETAWARRRCTAFDVGRVVVAGVGTVLIAVPAWLGSYNNPHGFSDNRAISMAPLFEGGPSRLRAYLDAGAMARELTRGLDVRVALHGSHANLAYTGEFPVAIETAAGLTDAYIARLPVRARGMVGHEKNFRQFAGYLQRRGVLINFHLAWRGGNAVDHLTDVSGRPLRQIELVHPAHPGVVLPGVLVTYRRELLDEIGARSPGCAFVRFDRWLDDVYLPSLASRPVAKVRRELEAFDDYYFDHNDDPARRQPIAARAGG